MIGLRLVLLLLLVLFCLSHTRSISARGAPASSHRRALTTTFRDADVGHYTTVLRATVKRSGSGEVSLFPKCPGHRLKGGTRKQWAQFYDRSKLSDPRARAYHGEQRKATRHTERNGTERSDTKTNRKRIIFRKEIVPDYD